jgi:chitinase
VNRIGRRRLFAAGLALAGSLTVTVVVPAPAAWAVGATSLTSTTEDTTPPSAPTNLRQIGTYAGQPVLGWDASTDDSGSIDHYSILANGTQIYRPHGLSVRVSDLVTYCHLIPGQTYTITVKAVDAASNKSAPSNALNITI